MAPANGVPLMNGFHPPPSSILATRVVNGDDASEFNQDSFNQLLEESLGTDENGQPNLGSDVSINHKLICIIIKAGVGPFLRDLRENPFRSSAASSSTDAQSCVALMSFVLLSGNLTRSSSLSLYPKTRLAMERKCPSTAGLSPRSFPF